ncbi:hypothetical protein O3651_06495 [Streptococcus sp. 27098_8_73]|uniref:hypothetical protein n=1 Tax=Streptococcus sp. 27098_8_73 TaxID=3003668 RepID=UPI00352FAD3B
MLKFIDKYFWWCLLVIIVMVISMSLLLGNYSGLYCWFYKNAYLDNTNLVTISTVFIGIYFSLYGFFTSADTNSFIAKLKLKEYKRLISIINRGFISSFTIVLFSFVNEILYHLLDRVYILFLLLVFILLIGSALQIAIYFSLLLRNDINTKYNSLKEDIKKENLDDEIRGKLKQFLDREL